MQRLLVFAAILGLGMGSVTGARGDAVSGDGEPPHPAPADAPSLLHYQGRFVDSGGMPLAGPVTLQFQLYASASGGGVLWTEIHENVELSEGIATVLLGSRVTFPGDAFSQPSRYLEITVAGAVLSPRLRLASVPFALEAQRLQGKAAADFEPKGTVTGLAVGDLTPPNVGSNRVHWQNLTGVPEGLADGEDMGVVVHARLDSLDADDHPQYLLRTESSLGDGTPPNQGSNLVHWDNLVGVPSGFADGADNTGPGGATDHGELTGLGDDDHPQYATDADLGAHTAAADPHAQYATDADLGAHTAAADPHPQYAGTQDLDDHAELPGVHHEKTVDASELSAGTLDPARLPPGGIDSTHVRDGSLSAADFDTGILDSLGLSPGAVDSTHIAPGAVRSVHLGSGAVTAEALGPGAVGAAALASNAVTGDTVADDSLSAADLRDEPGVVFGASTGVEPIGDPVEDVLQRIIDCPADGWVLAVAAGQSCIDSPPVDSDNLIVVSVSSQSESLDPVSKVTFRMFAYVGEIHCAPFTSQKLFPVSAGPNLFYVTAQGNGSAPLTVSQLTLSLTYFPTEY